MLKKIFFAFTLTILCKPAIAQDAALTNFLQRFDQESTKHAQEKVYLHLDKPYYVAGEDIWFKAYVVNAKTGQLSTISGLLYVELVEQQGSTVQQLKLPIKNGIAWGDFKLPYSIREGSYRVRSYTQWMRNAGENFFFNQKIEVINPQENVMLGSIEKIDTSPESPSNTRIKIKFADLKNSPCTNCAVEYKIKQGESQVHSGKGITNSDAILTIDIPKKLQSELILASITLPSKQVANARIPFQLSDEKLDIQFFPEGGTMMMNVPNRIAVKAIASNGKGSFISGTVENHLGTQVADFKTNHLGMGSFYVTPAKDAGYRAIINHGNRTDTLPLPAASGSRTALAVDNLDSLKMRIRIYSSADLADEDKYLLVHQNGLVYYQIKVPPLNGTPATLTIPKDSLPNGIVQVSLLSNHFIPLNERIVFIDNTGNKKVALSIGNINPSYQKKENVDLSVLATNQERPANGSFSVSVASLSVSDGQNLQDNILTGLLLTSEIAGNVETPGYYFLKNDQNTRYDLDNLLLSQGWRRINWKKIQTDTGSMAYPPEKTLRVTGKAVRSGKPLANYSISLISVNNGFFATDTLTDANGRFTFDNLDFWGAQKFMVQTSEEKDRASVDIIIDPILGQDKRIEAVPYTSISAPLKNNTSQYTDNTPPEIDPQKNNIKRDLRPDVIQLKEVSIEKKQPISKSSKPTYASSNIIGPGNADAVFTSEDLKHSMSLIQFLQGKVASVHFRQGKAYSRGSREPMAVILDNVYLGDSEYSSSSLDDVSIDNIETVEILKSMANSSVYGALGGAGVIVLTSKKGGIVHQDSPPLPGLVNYSTEGYSVSREFYIPKYDVKPDNKPDGRTTVFWEPNLITDKDGRAKISYLNTDTPGTYRIIIEGIDVNGNLARKVLTYEVK